MERPGFRLKTVARARGKARRMRAHLLWRLEVIFQRWRGHSGRYRSRAGGRKGTKDRKGSAKREVAMWPGRWRGWWRQRCGGNDGGSGLDLRMGVRARLYDFARFTLKAFSRLMDDFSLTNSDCELSAREIPGTSRRETGGVEPPVLRSSLRGASRRAPFRSVLARVPARSHKLSSPIKTLLPAWLRFPLLRSPS